MPEISLVELITSRKAKESPLNKNEKKAQAQSNIPTKLEPRTPTCVYPAGRSKEKTKSNRAKQLKPNKPPQGQYRITLVCTSCTLIFKSITTNKKRTAIAPTYTIIKINPKNSTFNKNKSAAAVINNRIKTKIEYTVF